MCYSTSHEVMSLKAINIIRINVNVLDEWSNEQTNNNNIFV